MNENSSPSPRKGTFVIRTSAVLFLVSAGYELCFLTSEVPLFGALREGLAATAYHAVYGAIFLALAIGLWAGTRWGYWLVFGGTLYYTLDKIRYVLDEAALEASYVELEKLLEILGFLNEDLVLNKERSIQLFLVVALLFAGCWWGFALYIYLRRGYFQSRRPPASNCS